MTAPGVRPRAGRLPSAAIAGALAAVALAATTPAAADRPPPHPRADEVMSPAEQPRTMSYEIGPVIGDSGSYPSGAVELLVRVRNGSNQPRKGSIVVTPDESWGNATVGAFAAFTVNPGGESFVRLPVRATTGLAIEATVEDGEPPWSTRLYSRTANDVAITFLNPTTPARAALLGGTVIPAFDPPEMRGGGGGTTVRSISIHVPRIDAATGDPLLPERTIGWTHEDLVVARTDTLGRIDAGSMEALAGFVLGGGTLALTVARPEDLRAPRMVALLGGDASQVPAPPEAHAPLDAGTAHEGPRAAEGTRLTGWAGGNLRPSPFGAVATYGLGEVVLLSFDPDDANVIGDRFVQTRLLDLASRGFDRRATVALDTASEAPYGGAVEEEIRRQLDPNENTRWTVGVAALLLLAYAIVAGPVSFARATRKGKPLRALWHLPVWSLVTFLVIVALGAFAKGLTGRSRRITLVDAGAGIDVGVARRWRGFYAARATDVEVRATDRSSFLWMASVEGADLLAGARLVAERDGARLVDVPALPWECVVVREDGFASLGEGIGVEDEGNGAVTLTNGTGRALRGVLVKQADDSFRYLPRVEPGATVRALDGEDLSADPKRFASFLRTVATGRPAGRMTVHPFGAWQLESSLFEDEARGLGPAWKAVEQAVARASIDWFPSGVPVVLAQIDGGEGRGTDSGFRLDQDRLLVRVVGWGR